MRKSCKSTYFGVLISTGILMLAIAHVPGWAIGPCEQAFDVVRTCFEVNLHDAGQIICKSADDGLGNDIVVFKQIATDSVGHEFEALATPGGLTERTCCDRNNCLAQEARNHRNCRWLHSCLIFTTDLSCPATIVHELSNEDNIAWVSFLKDKCVEAQ